MSHDQGFYIMMWVFLGYSGLRIANHDHEKFLNAFLMALGHICKMALIVHPGL